MKVAISNPNIVAGTLLHPLLPVDFDNNCYTAATTPPVAVEFSAAAQEECRTFLLHIHSDTTPLTYLKGHYQIRDSRAQQDDQIVDLRVAVAVLALVLAHAAVDFAEAGWI